MKECTDNKFLPIVIGLLLWTALSVFLQMNFQYHFYYVEQGRMFLFTESYFEEQVFAVGGLAAWIAGFLNQFFILPFAGAGIVSALLLAIGGGVRYIMRHLSAVHIPLFAALPSLALLPLHFDFNYCLQGTVAFLMMTLACCAYVAVSSDWYRIWSGLGWVVVVYLLAGSVALPLAVLFCLYEWLRKTPRGFLVLSVLVEVLVLAVVSVFASWVGEFRLAFSPEMYYHPMLRPQAVVYAAWIAFPLSILFAWFFRGRTGSRRLWIVGLQVVALVVTVCSEMRLFSNRSIRKLEKLDYFTRTEQWDKTIEEGAEGMNNLMFLNHLHLALAHKGELASRMLSYGHAGVEGLFVPWNKVDYVSALLSDIYFAVGAVASAQEMAFESYVTTIGGASPRMLKRLVQTNLIYGEYAVAEKYISLLEKTFYYKEWATRHRRFLNDDRAVLDDPVLGSRRRALPVTGKLVSTNDFSKDLRLIVETCPDNPVALQYLGMMYLLSGDLDSFRELIEKYTGTDCLPVLPVHFQEAVIVLFESDEEAWKRFRVSPSVIDAFGNFRKAVLARTPGERLRAEFGHTYWYYYMSK